MWKRLTSLRVAGVVTLNVGRQAHGAREEAHEVEHDARLIWPQAAQLSVDRIANRSIRRDGRFIHGKELRETHSERVGESSEGRERRVTMTVLDLADVRGVEVGELRQFTLRELASVAKLTEAAPEGAGQVSRLRGRLRHPWMGRPTAGSQP